jgi:hypothetical protein
MGEFFPGFAIGVDAGVPGLRTGVICEFRESLGIRK